MSRSSMPWVPVALLGLLVTQVLAAPTGTVVLKDGRRWENVQFEIRGNRMQVTFPNNRGGIEVSLDEVASYRADTSAPPAGGEDEEAAPEATAPTASDWEARFLLEPPEGWQTVAPSSPLMRAQLRHAQRDATLSVFVRQVAGDWDLGARQLAREIQDDVNADLGSRYARAAGARMTVSALFDTPVLKVEVAQVTELGSTTNKKLTELRFRRFGLEYSLSYLVLPSDDAALAPTLKGLFESFTFLPAVTCTDDLYSDYGRGFAVERANADWQLLGALFDPEQPVRVIIDGGRAELVVDVHAGTDAEAVVRGIITKRQQTSRTLSNMKVEPGEQGGSPVKRFQFEDYRDPGGRKKLLYRGFGAQVAGHVVVFTAVHPLADDDARKLEGELSTMLEKVRLWDADRIRGQLATAQNVLALVAQGVAASGAKRHQEALGKFDEAIRLAPGFARAFYLRANTKRDLGDFNGQRQDLEQAATLDPTQGYDAELIASHEAEAKAAENAKNFAEALRLWLRIYRAGRTEERLRKVTGAAQQLYNEYKKDAKQLDRNLGSIERDLRPVASEATVAGFLFNTYKDAAGTFMREKNFSKAKKWANKAKSLANDARMRNEVDGLLQQIDQAAERNR